MIKLYCKKHPKYKAIFPPRCKCEACKELYDIRVNAPLSVEIED